MVRRYWRKKRGIMSITTIEQLKYDPRHPNSCEYCGIRSAHLSFSNEDREIHLCKHCITQERGLNYVDHEGVQVSKGVSELGLMCLDLYDHRNWIKKR